MPAAPLAPALALAVAVVVAGCGPAPAACPDAAGDLEIRQLRLAGPPPGEAAIVTGPDGTTLLIDVGAGPHDGAVRAAAGGPVDLLLLTHEDVDHAGALDDLADVVAGAQVVAGLGTWDLGGGASLEVFLADGVLATPEGPLDLRAEVPDLDDSENARSLAGVVRWGRFAYVFAGDLTGGGKGTPDVESAVAARGDALLPAGDADVVHLSHHGIRSSTNQAWVDWLLPDDGAARSAVAGSNRGYLSAPDDEVVERVAPRLDGGAIHVPEAGSLAREHPALIDHRSDVLVTVVGGDRYAICGAWFDAT